MAEVDGFPILEGIRPNHGWLFRIRHGPALHEALRGIGIDHHRFVQERRPESRMLNHVVDAPELVAIRHGLDGVEPRAVGSEIKSPFHMEARHGQVSGHANTCGPMLEDGPGHLGGFTVPWHAIGCFGFRREPPTVKAEKVAH